MKYLSIFASVLLATASAYGQSGEKLPDGIRSDSTKAGIIRRL